MLFYKPVGSSNQLGTRGIVLRHLSTRRALSNSVSGRKRGFREDRIFGDISHACLGSGMRRLPLAVIGPLKNARIKYGEDLFKHTVRHPPDAPGLARMKID